jgi:hypothetical protein
VFHVLLLLFLSLFRCLPYREIPLLLLLSSPVSIMRACSQTLWALLHVASKTSVARFGLVDTRPLLDLASPAPSVSLQKERERRKKELRVDEIELPATVAQAPKLILQREGPETRVERACSETTLFCSEIPIDIGIFLNRSPRTESIAYRSASTPGRCLWTSAAFRLGDGPSQLLGTHYRRLG